MKIRKLTVKNFRNFDNIEIFPCENVNIIYGDNAQGKTNIIEAIWIFTGAKSFRGAKDEEYIKIGQNFCNLNIEFFANEREQNAQIKISDKKIAYLNEIKKTSVQKFAGEFNCVVFAPVHLSLIKDGPNGRRRFLDTAIGQIMPKYIGYITEYYKILLQRNAVLKDIKYNSSLFDMLDIWDNQIANVGANIIFIRDRYIKKLLEYAKPIYTGMSSGKENLDIKYCSCIKEYVSEMDTKQIKKLYLENLVKIRKQDIITGTTNIGIHRDDIDFYVNEKYLKSFGSQGQQRSCVLSLKLAECGIIYSITKNKPIILFDDVMSELDNKRKDYILNNIKDKQVFITCCDKTYFENIKNGRSYLINDGKIIKTKDYI